MRKGLTIGEMVIGLIIIGVIMVVIYPSYNNYLIREKVPEATAALVEKRTQMAQFFQQNRTYAGAPACTKDESTSKNFIFMCNRLSDGSGYSLHAIGRGAMAGFSYTIDQSNDKATSIAAPAPTAWIASNTGCWVINRGGTC